MDLSTMYVTLANYGERRDNYGGYGERRDDYGGYGERRDDERRGGYGY